jgi:hypothetical protein
MWSMRAMRRGAMAVLVVHVRSAVPRPRRWTPPRSRRSEEEDRGAHAADRLEILNRRHADIAILDCCLEQQ